MTKTTSLSSRRPRCRWTMPAASSPHSRRAFPTSSGRGKTTSAMPRKTARMRSNCWSEQCDVVVVVGSPNSSNSNRLREVAANVGVPAYLVNDADGLQPGVVCRQSASRRQRGRFGPRVAGAGRSQAPVRDGRVQCHRVGGYPGKRRFPVAQGAASLNAPDAGNAFSHRDHREGSS